MIFLDEPFSGLDPVAAEVMERVLHRHTASGGTVVFSSHVLDQVERVCDRLVIIDRGRVLLHGTMGEVTNGRRLQDVFVELVGGTITAQGDLEWLGSSSDLKLRLLRRGVTRSGVIGVVLFVLMCLLSAAVGVGAGLGAGALIESAADPVLMTSLIFTLVFALWLVIPLFTAGLDETLDPRRFALFPLRGATIVSGLAAAALIGPGALTTALTLGGAARGLGAEGPPSPWWCWRSPWRWCHRWFGPGW